MRVSASITASPSEMMAAAGEWNALTGECQHARIFQRTDWCRPWWRAVGARVGTCEPVIVQVRDVAGDLVGLAPLMLDGGGQGKVVRFLGDPYTDYHDFIYRRELRDEVLAAVFDAVADVGWESMQLNEIPSSSPTVPWLAAHAVELAAEITETSVCPAIDLTDREAVERVLRINEYERKNAKLQGLGKVKCEHVREQGEISRLFPVFRSMHLRQWHGRPGVVGGFDEEHVTEFFLALIEEMGAHGNVILTCMSLDGRPVAFYLGMDDRRSYRAYRTAYDVSLGRLSPGAVMLRQMIIDFRAEGYHTFDFMRGAYPYKGRFASLQISNIGFKVAR